MSDAPSAKVIHGVVWAWLVILAASALLLHLHLAVNLDFDGELLSADAEALYGLRCVRNGEPLYLNFSHPPYSVTLYTPLIYAVPGTVARLLNTSWIGTMVCGRGYTYAAWLGVGVMLYALGRQLDCERSLAAVAPLLWLSGTLAWQWAVAYRPDAVVILLSLSALWIYQRAKSPQTLAMVIALLVTAFLHKQNSVAVLLGIVVTEMSRRQFRRAAVILGGWTICVAAAVLLMQVVTHGVFIMNTFGATRIWVSPSQTWWLLRTALAQGLVVFVGGGLACLIMPQDEQLAVARRSFVISFAVALIISMKVGANVNYYLESFALGCVLTGAMVRYWMQRAGTKLTAAWGGGCYVGLAFAIAVMVLWTRAERFPEWWRAAVDHRSVRAQQAQAWERVTACVGECNERMLVEDLYLALRQSRNLLLMHPQHFEALRVAGMFDDTELRRRIAAGDLDAIIASFPLEDYTTLREFPSRWLDAARGRYVLEKRCGSDPPGSAYYIYRPLGK